jgi:hypothetical protein
MTILSDTLEMHRQKIKFCDFVLEKIGSSVSESDKIARSIMQSLHLHVSQIGDRDSTHQSLSKMWNYSSATDITELFNKLRSAFQDELELLESMLEDLTGEEYNGKPDVVVGATLQPTEDTTMSDGKGDHEE